MRAVVQHAAPLQRVHDFGASDQRRDWQAAAQRFAEGHEIGREFVVFLAAAGSDAESGYGFIEDEKIPLARAISAGLADILQPGESRPCLP